MPIFHVHITLLFLLENGPQILILVFRQKIKDCASFTLFTPTTNRKNSLANIKRLNPIYKPISFLQMTSVLPLTIFIILS